jgi:hypothetical protein
MEASRLTQFLNCEELVEARSMGFGVGTWIFDGHQRLSKETCSDHDAFTNQDEQPLSASLSTRAHGGRCSHLGLDVNSV